MTTPMEADIVGELRKQASGIIRDGMTATGHRLRILADAVEVELAHGKQCHDLLRRIVEEYRSGSNKKFFKAFHEARELIGPTENVT